MGLPVLACPCTDPFKIWSQTETSSGGVSESGWVGFPLLHNLCFRAKERGTPVFLLQSFFFCCNPHLISDACSQNDAKLPCYSSSQLSSPCLGPTLPVYILLPQGPHHSTLDGPFVTSILLQLQSKWDKGVLAVKGKPSQT